MEANGPRFVGTLQHYDFDKGFGFLDCPELFEKYNANVYLHHSVLGASGLNASMLEIGQKITFGLHLSPKGMPQADHLTIVAGGGGGKKGGGKGKSSGPPGLQASRAGPGVPTGKGHGVPPVVAGHKVIPVTVGSVEMVQIPLVFFQELLEASGLALPRGPGGPGPSTALAMQTPGGPRRNPSGLVGVSGFSAGWWPPTAPTGGSLGFATTRLRHPTLLNYTGGKVTGQWMTGTFKSFVIEKGYGFISCPEVHEKYGRDAFVHASVLNPGLGGRIEFVPDAGEELLFTVSTNAEGHPQANAPIISKARFFSGHLRDWHDGYGFITCTDLKQIFECDVYLHSSVVDHTGLRPFVGATVSFALHLNKDGKPQASFPTVEGGYEAPAKRAKIEKQVAMMAAGGEATGEEFKRYYAGVLARYDAEKGHGFIECSDLKAAYSRDVYCHKSVVEEAGAQVGSQVIFPLHVNKNGFPQASKPVFLVDRPLEGVISSWNPDKGFGFIQCSETKAAFGKDVYLHNAVTESAGIVPAEGLQLQFQLHVNKNGDPQASQPVMIGGLSG